MFTEEAHRAGSEPVHEGGLVEEADAVDVRGDVVVAVKHLAGDLEVDGVDVVEEAGGEEAADLEDEPEEDDDGEGAAGLGGGVRSVKGVGTLRTFSCKVFIGCELSQWTCHKQPDFCNSEQSYPGVWGGGGGGR